MPILLTFEAFNRVFLHSRDLKSALWAGTLPWLLRFDDTTVAESHVVEVLNSLVHESLRNLRVRNNQFLRYTLSAEPSLGGWWISWPRFAARKTACNVLGMRFDRSGVFIVSGMSVSGDCEMRKCKFSADVSSELFQVWVRKLYYVHTIAVDSRHLVRGTLYDLLVHFRSIHQQVLPDTRHHWPVSSVTSTNMPLLQERLRQCNFCNYSPYWMELKSQLIQTEFLSATTSYEARQRSARLFNF